MATTENVREVPSATVETFSKAPFSFSNVGTSEINLDTIGQLLEHHFSNNHFPRFPGGTNTIESASPAVQIPLIQPVPTRKQDLALSTRGEPVYVDVTPFLGMPQHKAAKEIGIPSSTLSKRWKEASLNRKWPYRVLSKLEKEIDTLLKNSKKSEQQCDPNSLSLPLQATLSALVRRKKEELRQVVIRIS